MKYLSLHERDVVSVGTHGSLSELEADSIAQLQPLLPKGVLAWEYRALRFGPFCGVLRTRHVTIELLPKIAAGLQSLLEVRGLLVAMLAAVGELRRTRVGEADLGQQRAHLLDIFIEDFCECVRVALRGGAIAAYSERTENLNAIRGRLELTDHLRRNAFDRARLLCRFDERSIDNPFNRALKAVLRLLNGFSLSPRTKAIVTSLQHRFDEVADSTVRASDIDALSFDRTHAHWRDVFEQAGRLLSGLYPDVRVGDASGSALLFDMEKLFEEVLGRRIRRECQKLAGRHLRVDRHGPQRNLAAPGFLLKPDITIHEDEQMLAIVDAKWKQLLPSEPNAGVSTGDAYQMNAYASRYRCDRLALAYPASLHCAPGHIREFSFQTLDRAVLNVVAIDIRDLAFGSGIPPGLETVIPFRHPFAQQRSPSTALADM